MEKLDLILKILLFCLLLIISAGAAIVHNSIFVSLVFLLSAYLVFNLIKEKDGM